MASSGMNILIPHPLRCGDYLLLSMNWFHMWLVDDVFFRVAVLLIPSEECNSELPTSILFPCLLNPRCPVSSPC